jgi:uncharacterized protein (TIGR03435 family)
MRSLLAGALAVLITRAAFGQTTGAPPTFGDVEIRSSAPNTIPEMRVRFSQGKYEVHNATPADLIRTAWGVGADKVVGGPDWLDTQRFDLIATAPAGSTPEALKTLLQGVLKDRFQLRVHSDKKDTPAYAITAGKKPELEEADGSERTGCVQQGADPQPRGAPVTFACRNMTIAAFATAISGMRETSGYLFNYPVLDRTGLKGAWNFSLKWTPRNSLLVGPAAGDAITIFDAFEKQLGLKLSLAKIPEAVVVVDSVKAPRLAESQRSPMQFEVADIRPDDPDNPGLQCGYINVQPGGRVRINMTLRGLILETQGDFNSHRFEGGPKSMDGTCWLIVAKAPAQEDAPAGWNGPSWNGLDIDSMRAMLRSLLEDRFKLVAHTEDRMVNGYALVAVKPKLRKADPSNRPGCREGPGADGRDPRLQNPLASRLITCRNITLAQFAAELNRSNTGTGAPVVDSTRLDGRYDLTINFSPPSAFPKLASPNAGDNSVASEPNGAISISEALSSQLGLKLQAREVPSPVLVIDHLDDKPTDN